MHVHTMVSTNRTLHCASTLSWIYLPRGWTYWPTYLPLQPTAVDDSDEWLAWGTRRVPVPRL